VVAQKDSTVTESVVKLHYFNSNNNLQYLLLESMLKKGKILTPQNNKTYELYLDSGAENMIAKVQTDENGKAKAFIPPSLKAAWDASPQHTFVVKAGKEEVLSDFSITKAKITLDTVTVDSVRSITASVMKLENKNWVPAKDVEMKIGIQRQGGILTAGDAETYTTDSTGVATVEFKKDSLPGDQNGNIVLAAKVEDNDEFGNLLAEKKVSWGTAGTVDKNFFNQRTLWSTRFRTPVWLLAMAYSIFFSVWGTLIYLVFQLVKIKKLGV
jgi:hypothetical protein